MLAALAAAIFLQARGMDAALVAATWGLFVVMALWVVVGLLLYALVAGKITTRPAVAIANRLFSLIAWSLAYGLLCIVFALVLPA